MFKLMDKNFIAILRKLILHYWPYEATISLFPIKMIGQTRKETKVLHKTRAKHRSPTIKGSNNKQCINNNRTHALERTAVYAAGGEMHFTGTKSSPKIMLLFKLLY